MAYFYRRPNGVFYARIRVPDSLRSALGAADLRRSLNTTDHATALRLSLGVVLAWKTEFHQRQTMIDASKLTTGSPALLTGGLIRLDEAADAVGLKIETMLREAMVKRSMLRLMADGWLGADVPRSELVRDNDPEATKRTLILDVGETLLGRQLAPVTGTLRLRLNSLVCVENGVFTDCLFFRDAARRQAVVVPFPGISAPVGTLLIAKADAEAIRANLASKVTPAMLETARQASATASPANDLGDQLAVAVAQGAEEIKKTVMGPAYKHQSTSTSAMLKAFYAAKDWALGTREQNKRMCAVFVELMGDPLLGAIDREMIVEYMARLQTLPDDLRNVKVDNPGKTLSELIALAAVAGWPKQDGQRAGRYVMKIGEAFEWAAANGYMPRNPAARIVEKPKASVRAQDKRQQFDTATLNLIFGQQWFRDGRGEKTKKGLYHEFQPFHFWLPLLGLFTGARINELAQLHLSDVVHSEAGNWYLNFNLDSDDKINADEKDKEPADTGKRFKTLNSHRVAPLHPELIRLGLPAYVAALRAAGAVRLFPELRHDPMKGFGKHASQFFNEKFLGNRLKIERNGKQTFHSFRHSFLTACDRLNMPDRVRNEIAGHGRGEGQGHANYIKDRTADELAPFLAPLKFELPNIAVFDVAEGIQAMRDALGRKKNHADKKARREHSAKQQEGI